MIALQKQPIFCWMDKLSGKPATPLYSVTRKNRQMSLKVAQKWFHYKNERLTKIA